MAAFTICVTNFFLSTKTRNGKEILQYIPFKNYISILFKDNFDRK